MNTEKRIHKYMFLFISIQVFTWWKIDIYIESERERRLTAFVFYLLLIFRVISLITPNNNNNNKSLILVWIFSHWLNCKHLRRCISNNLISSIFEKGWCFSGFVGAWNLSIVSKYETENNNLQRQWQQMWLSNGKISLVTVRIFLKCCFNLILVRYIIFLQWKLMFWRHRRKLEIAVFKVENSRKEKTSISCIRLNGCGIQNKQCIKMQENT